MRRIIDLTRVRPGVRPGLAALALLCAGGCSGDETGRAKSTNEPPDAGVDGPVGAGGARSEAGPPPPELEDAEARADVAAPPDAEAGPPEAGPETGVEGSPPPAPVCGDGERNPDEECDDGNPDDRDFCTSDCRIVDRVIVELEDPAGPAPLRRSIARGGHVAAASEEGGAVLFLDEETSPPALGLMLFRKDGERALGVGGASLSEATRPYEPTDASVAALPGDRYAVAWVTGDADDDGLGIALRTVEGATGAMTPMRAANTRTTGTQTQVDAVWTGTEVVVAWTDAPMYSARRARYQRFTAELVAVGEETAVEASRPNAAPVLAAFAGDLAIAWQEPDTASGIVHHVRAGSVEWTVSGFSDAAGDRVRLVALDADRLFLAVTGPVYPDAGPPTPRLWGAVLDTGAPGAVEPFAIEPMDPLFSHPSRPQRRPAVAVVGDRLFVAWHTQPGFVSDSSADRLFLKEITWASQAGGLIVDLSLPELSLPSGGTSQDYPALTAAPWTPGGALLAAWEDNEQLLSATERRPDVLARLMPIPMLPREVVRHDD